MAMYRRKKKPAVLAGSRSTTTGFGARAPQRSSAQLTGKRKAKVLTISGGTLEPSNRRPLPNGWSAPLLKSASAVTGQHAASCSRQGVSPEGRVTYAVVLVGSVTRFIQDGHSSL